MPENSFSSVNEYIAAQPEPAQAALERVRLAIRKALPGSGEAISYKMPAYRLDGAIVLYFAGWKEHYSLYPIGQRAVAAFNGLLDSYKVSNGTLRFPLSEPVPTKLIGRIAKFRAKEFALSLKSRQPAGRSARTPDGASRESRELGLKRRIDEYNAWN